MTARSPGYPRINSAASEGLAEFVGRAAVDPVLIHEFAAEAFVGFDPGGCFDRADTSDAFFGEGVDESCFKRGFGADDGVLDIVFFGEGQNCRYIRFCMDEGFPGYFRDARILFSHDGVEFDVRIFGEC